MAITPRPIDVLVVTELAIWPLDLGYRVHGFHMARALSQRGLNVRIACLRDNPPDTPAMVRDLLAPWPQATPEQHARFDRHWSGPLGALRRRLADHQALDTRELAGVIPLVEYYQPKVVLALGQHGPAILRGLPSQRQGGPARVWYAADEGIYFQLSCMRYERFKTWRHRWRAIAVHGCIERGFGWGLEGAIGVSPRDTALLRRIAGVRSAVTIRNGVDLDYYQPAPASTKILPQSLAFWGRLDFEPNIDAVCWLAKTLWPRIKQRWPRAICRIAGKKPHPRVIEAANTPGIQLLGEVPDIRPIAQTSAAVVLPMRCGGGIKNKLLEAAAMALPIIATPQAVSGLELDAPQPMLVCGCGDVPAWIDAIGRLWSDPVFSANLRQAASHWIRLHHRWDLAAEQLCQWLRDDLNVPIEDEELITAELDEQPLPPRQAA